MGGSTPKASAVSMMTFLGCPAPNDAQALAEGLRLALATGPEARESMTARAVAHVRARFTKPRMCAATLAVYEEVLSR